MIVPDRWSHGFVLVIQLPQTLADQLPVLFVIAPNVPALW